jgi:hypothetical protein
MSIFDAFQPNTATITIKGAINEDKPFAPTTDTTASTQCRYKKVNKQIWQKDGTYLLAAMEVMCPIGVSFPTGCTVSLIGDTFTVLSQSTVPDVFGNQDHQILYLE